MSDSKNYETTFNHFLLRFLRYLCNFCPNTCSQEAILMKVSHLSVVTLHQRARYLNRHISVTSILGKIDLLRKSFLRTSFESSRHLGSTTVVLQ
jgi:hypothetical protein